MRTWHVRITALENTSSLIDFKANVKENLRRLSEINKEAVSELLCRHCTGPCLTQPGEYQLVAASDLPGWQQQDAAIVAHLAGNGMKLELGSREFRVVGRKIPATNGLQADNINAHSTVCGATKRRA